MVRFLGLKVAIITENFLPKVDGSYAPRSCEWNGEQCFSIRDPAQLKLLQKEFAGCRIYESFGFPFSAYSGLKINFMSPTFIGELRVFDPDVVHLVDPMWLGVQGHAAIKMFFPDIHLVRSQDTNLPTYAAIFGFPYYYNRCWRGARYVHSLAVFTLVPSPSTATLSEARGFANLRICDRGVDPELFCPGFRDPSLRRSWGLNVNDLAVLSVGRLSLEKNLFLLVNSFSLLPKCIRDRAVLIFVGDGPLAARLRQVCTDNEVRAIFLGQLTGKALGQAFASGDIMSSPSFTKTFRQVTLEAMASGLPVVRLYAEGTADLVTHMRTGLLLDVHAAARSQDWDPSLPLDSDAHVANYDSCAHLMRPLSASFTAVAARYASLLELLLSDHILRADMRAAALVAAQEYPWERCTERILSAYVDAAQPCTRRRPARLAWDSGFFRFVVDAVGVALAILIAGLSHALYMIPTIEDLAS
ncbi:hypothetical protein B0H11DRAFT_2232022 [Mycena galericulata]|nr:hypothetical protein B0H11DRAFT_2232022 [Mycena galericulata]